MWRFLLALVILIAVAMGCGESSTESLDNEHPSFAVIDGTMGAINPAANSRIVLINNTSNTMVDSTNPDAMGNFTLIAHQPGDYLVLAGSEDSSGEWIGEFSVIVEDLNNEIPLINIAMALVESQEAITATAKEAGTATDPCKITSQIWKWVYCCCYTDGWGSPFCYWSWKSC